MPRLLDLRPWLGLAFLASAAIACLNPQPEPPTESAAVAGPGDRGNDGAVGEDPGGGKGSSGTGGKNDGESSGEPPDPDGDGDFGNGAGGTTSGSAGGGPNTGTPPDGAAGSGGSAAPPDDPGGGGGAGGADDEGGSCNACGEVLERGGTPCPSAIEKLGALVACCDTSCGACRERIVRGDRVGNQCTECLADACAEALAACKAD